MNVSIRKGEKKDIKALHDLVVELAIYEKEPDAVITTLEEFEQDGFGNDKVFDFIVAEVDGNVVGFALFYTGYSTWKGRTLYLEDFVVTENMRGHGIGKLLFDEVVEEAKRRNVKRMDWQVLDWNEPAINFYKKYNAELDPEWLNGRLFFE